MFGEYRPATGVEGQQLQLTGDRVDTLRARLDTLTENLGHRPRLVVGKPGLDGHSNGAEVIAVSARHVGFDVIYSGIRLSADEIVTSAVEEGADVIGASVLSGSHMALAEQIMAGLRANGAEGLNVVLGGIVPESDFDRLYSLGVRQVYTPADYELLDIMDAIVGMLEQDISALAVVAR